MFDSGNQDVRIEKYRPGLEDSPAAGIPVEDSPVEEDILAVGDILAVVDIPEEGSPAVGGSRDSLEEVRLQHGNKRKS